MIAMQKHVLLWEATVKSHCFMCLVKFQNYCNSSYRLCILLMSNGFSASFVMAIPLNGIFGGMVVLRMTRRTDPYSS